MRIIITIGLVLLGLTVSGQEEYLNDPVFPDKTDFEKFVSFIPYPGADGTVNIKVPLYTVRAKSINLPIYLSYNTRGLRVDELSSHVGLGWNINTGGGISRQVLGKPDNGFRNSTAINEELTQLYVKGVDLSTKYKYFEAAKSKLPFDHEYDCYTFSTLSGDGAFYITKDGIITLSDNDQYKVTKVSNEAFEIIDGKGMIYKYGKNSKGKGYCVNDQNTDGGPSVYTNWCLTEITNPVSQDTIKFEYKRIGKTTKSPYQERTTPLPGMLEEARSSIDSDINIGRSCYVITKIWTNNISVSFTYLPSEDDLLHERLAEISIRDRSKLKKVIKLENGNFFDGRKSNKLLGVGFYDDKNHLLNKYKFGYNSNSLAPYGSFSKDYWGFYNGARNSNLLPKKRFDYFNQSSVRSFIDVGSANRESNFKNMKSGVLNKIIYPTGGYTSLTYEANKIIKKNKEQTIEKISVGISSEGAGGTVPNNPHVEKKFIIEKDTRVTISTTNIRGHGYKYASLLDENQKKIYHFNPLYPDSQTDVSEMFLSSGEYTLIAHAGTSTVSDNSSIIGTTYVSINVMYDIVDDNEIEVQQEVGGLRVQSITSFDADNTVSLKKEYQYSGAIYMDYDINQTDIYHKQTSTTSYKYFQDPLSPTITSTIHNLTFIKSASNRLLPTRSSSVVEYEKITETLAGKTPMGKIEYLYSSTPEKKINFLDVSRNLNGVSSIDDNIMKSLRVCDTRRPHLRRKLIYSTEEDGGYFLKEENVYDYESVLVNKIKGLKIGKTKQPIFVCGPGIVQPVHLIGNLGHVFFEQELYIDRLKEHTTNFYFSNSSRVVQKKNILYDNEYRNLVREEHVVIDDTDILKTKLTYPFDLNSSVYQSMKEKNMIGQIIEKNNYRNDMIIGGQLIKYKKNLNTYVPFTISSFKTNKPILSFIPFTATENEDSHYNMDISFDKYDEFGNILQYHLNSGQYNSNLWGYNNQYPIIKAINVKYDESETELDLVGATSRASKKIGNVSYTNLDDYLYALGSFVDSSKKMDISKVNSWNTFVSEITKALPKASMSFYTYDPLIGMTSQTDSNGITVYYQYDSFGRLEFVKDDNGNILKHHTYHYQNQ